jgi:coenzyme PQQ biosynthesis protein C
VTSTPNMLSADELEATLRRVGAQRYHNLHRFHRRLHGGQCTYEEVQAWALNRYYYQAMIPIKDATVLTRLTNSDDRRQWRSRIEDHDGKAAGDGGIERWLKLTDSLGFPRDYVISTEGLLPGTRFAVEAYVEFCRSRTPLEAVASSLTELFSPMIIGERVAGMLANYDFVSKDTLAYFAARPPQASRDAEWALNYVKTHAGSRAEQDKVIAALEFKCSVLWAQLDALWSAYVDHAVPPGAWVPGTQIKKHGEAA